MRGLSYRGARICLLFCHLKKASWIKCFVDSAMCNVNEIGKPIEMKSRPMVIGQCDALEQGAGVAKFHAQ